MQPAKIRLFTHWNWSGGPLTFWSELGAQYIQALLDADASFHLITLSPTLFDGPEHLQRYFETPLDSSYDINMVIGFQLTDFGLCFTPRMFNVAITDPVKYPPRGDAILELAKFDVVGVSTAEGVRGLHAVGLRYAKYFPPTANAMKGLLNP